MATENDNKAYIEDQQQKQQVGCHGLFTVFRTSNLPQFDISHES